jgi:ribosomal protein S18 acetylase RimI-like enzyme
MFRRMEIRAAMASDVPGVLPMVAKICELHRSWDAAKYAFKPHPEEMYRKWLTGRTTDSRSVFLVAVREKPVAFLIGTVETEIPIYVLKEYGFIHDLWVEEAYRHEGIGKQMTMVAIEKFAEIGVRQVRLDTAAANEPARRLFAACGFRPSTTEMLLELGGREAANG